MVWIHGGGFVGGAGALPSYPGDALARRGDVVFVSVNFRQGALGHLYLPGVSEGNLALHDIVAALQWIRQNIAAFGGNPDNITLFGQSSGGVAIAALLAMPSAQGLFHRAILQSAPLGRTLKTAEAAAAVGDRFAQILGVASDDAHAFQSFDVERLLAAQGELAKTLRPRALGFSEQAFAPVVDGMHLLPQGDAWGHAPGSGIDLLLGTLREEQAAQVAIDPATRSATLDQFEQAVRHLIPERASRLVSHYRQRRSSVSGADLICDFYTDLIFRLPSIRLAEQHWRSGQRSWLYQFDWPSPAGFGACHCLDLPFVFGSLEAYHDAPMLQGISPEFFKALSARIQDAWLSFAHTGSPAHADLPSWPVYGQDERATLRLDRHIETVKDLAGYALHPLN